MKSPGVVIGRKGTLGTVHYIEKDFWPHDTTLWVKDFKGNDPRFISYFLKTLKLERFDSGSSNPTLNRNHVHKIKVIFPDLIIQRKIAFVLSSYDKLIENSKLSISLLENMVEEIYREWFVRFRFPGHKSAKFKKGMPEEWRQTEIGKVVEFKSGFSFKSESYQPGSKFGIVTIKNVHDGRFIPQCTDHILEPPTNLPKHCYIKEGDILMSLTGNVGRVCIAYGHLLLLNQRVVCLKPRNHQHEFYLYWLFRQARMMTFTEMISTGAAQQNLSPVKLAAQKILYPNSTLIELYNNTVTPMMQEILFLLKKNISLEEAKASLLPNLISGRISVESLESQLLACSKNDVESVNEYIS